MAALARCRPTVVVVGAINTDLLLPLPALPRPGQTLLGDSHTSAVGGKGANQAVAAAGLDAHTVLIGCVGTDPAGRDALDELERRGVDTSLVARTADTPTGTAVVLTEPGGENLIGVAALAANARLSADYVTGALDTALRTRHHAERKQPATAVVLASLEVPLAAVKAAAMAAGAHDARFLLNPAPAQPLSASLLRHTWALIPNEHELADLAAATPTGLLNRGPHAVIVTRGAAGVAVYERRHDATADPYDPGLSSTETMTSWQQNAFPAAAGDTAGAGDAFNGALAWALAAGHDLRTAVRSAAAAGALATEYPGAQGATITRSDLDAVITRDAEAAANADADEIAHCAAKPA